MVFRREVVEILQRGGALLVGYTELGQLQIGIRMTRLSGHHL